MGLESIDKTLRFDEWRETLRRVCGNFETHAAERSDFSGRIAVQSFSGLDMAWIEGNADRITRDRQQVTQTSDENYFVIATLKGRSLMSQAGVDTVLETGDITLVDSGFASKFQYQDDFVHLSYHVPRSLLEQRLQGRKLRKLPRICGTHGSGAVLGNMMRMLYDQARNLSPSEGSVLRDILIDLMASTLTEPGVSSAGKALSSPQNSTLVRVRHIIEAHLADPDLNAQKLAAVTGISVRQLYRLFEAAGVTLGDFVREQRLEQCRKSLKNPKLLNENIMQIAFSWGFNDASHFSRAFRQRFGQSPRDYRRAQLAQLKR